MVVVVVVVVVVAAAAVVGRGGGGEGLVAAAVQCAVAKQAGALAGVTCTPNKAGIRVFAVSLSDLPAPAQLLLTNSLPYNSRPQTRLVSPRLHLTKSLYHQHHFSQPHPFSTRFPAPIPPTSTLPAFFLPSCQRRRVRLIPRRRRQHLLHAAS